MARGNSGPMRTNDDRIEGPENGFSFVSEHFAHFLARSTFEIGLKIIGVKRFVNAQKETECLIARAVRKTGLSDFGDEYFRMHFSKLIESFATEAELSRLGSELVRRRISLALENRLMLAEALKTEAIGEGSIRPPLFVIGLPRTGTTFLQRLLSIDAGCRPLITAETIRPAKCAQERSRNHLKQLEHFLRVVDIFFPRVRSMHDFSTSLPGETTPLFDSTFVLDTNMLPSYRSHFLSLPSSELQKSFNDTVAQLRLICGADRRQGILVLKSPSYLYFLPEIASRFPESPMILCRRDITPTILSMCEATQLYLSIVAPRRQEFAHEMVRDYVLEALYRLKDFSNFEEGTNVRTVLFDELTSDPISVIRRAYEHYGIRFSKRYERDLSWQWKVIAKQTMYKTKRRTTLSEQGFWAEVIDLDRSINFPSLPVL